ncbi:hypothetical protein N0V90_005992 [Kalmusia sp. IMI 367209]|nr:hypothetical protein N0V90_005992 [Kalmusia sp. IMI 367209]
MVSDSPPLPVSDYCDTQHGKLKALLDDDITFDRIAIIQASLLASLHWEGREGTNSAVNSLSLAIHVAQEMGLHCAFNEARNHDEDSGSKAFQRRLRWSVYTLDGFNAAQEGIPLIINKIDCDAPELNDDDLKSEDGLTQKIITLSFRLAHVIEKLIRKLYGLGNDSPSTALAQYVEDRWHLVTELDRLAQGVIEKLTPCNGDDVDDSNDLDLQWCSIMLCQ